MADTDLKHSRIIFLGPPGAGKGFYSQLIRQTYNILHISSGDLLRNAIKDETELGKKVKDIMDRGELVSDDVVIALLRKELSSDKAKNGFILDGFPRTYAQAKALKSLEKELNIPIDFVFYFDVSDKKLSSRLTERLIHPQSGRIYHTVLSPPKIPNVDDITGEPLVRRGDDKVEVILKRLQVYRDQTIEVKYFYEKENKLITINGELEAQENIKRIFKFMRGEISKN